jgi:sortase A
MFIKRDAAHNWAAFAIGAGLGISLWALLAVRAPLPPQEQPVAEIVATETATPEQTPETTPTPEETFEPIEIVPLVPKVLYPIRPEIDEKVGTITLPSLDLSWAIYEGTKEKQLSKGVGHYVGSVLPGIQDNSILSGHRTTVFNRLGELNQGDQIFVQTSAGVFTYQVREFRIVARTDQNVIMPTETAVLTLTTCYPFNNIGVTTQAFIVTADLIDSVYSTALLEQAGD